MSCSGLSTRATCALALLIGGKESQLDWSCKRSLSRFWLAAAVASLAFSFVTPSQANTITTYSFTDTSGGENVSGTLVDNGTIDVLTLTNNLASPGSVADAISGIILNFASNPGAVSLTSQTSGSGDLITITGKKGQTAGTGTTFAGNPDNWTSAGSGAAVTLSTNHDDHNPGNICATGAPCDLIVGPGPYTNSNASFDSHDPSVWKSAVFDLSGLTGLILSSAQFQFGTTPTNGAVLIPIITITGGNNPVPLPSALLLFAGGLGLIGFAGSRKRRKAARLAAA